MTSNVNRVLEDVLLVLLEIIGYALQSLQTMCWAVRYIPIDINATI